MNTDLRPLSPFQDFCVKFLGYVPSSYDDCMTYLECLIYTYNYLKDEIVPSVNTNNQVVQELKDYVEHYFDNLDVQEEINNKLDQMVLDGTLEEIITSYVQLKGMLTFDTVADMKNATNLVDGSCAKTLGYNNLNDGGEATYKVREITNEDVVDEALIIALNDNNLIAELIVKDNTFNLMQVGCAGDDTTDDTTLIQKAFDICVNNKYTLYIPNKQFLVTNTIVIRDTINVKGDSFSSYKRGSELDVDFGDTEKSLFTIGVKANRCTFENIKIERRRTATDGYPTDLYAYGKSGTCFDFHSNENAFNRLCIIGFGCVFSSAEITTCNECDFIYCNSIIKGSHYVSNVNFENCNMYANGLLFDIDGNIQNINITDTWIEDFISLLKNYHQPIQNFNVTNCTLTNTRQGEDYLVYDSSNTFSRQYINFVNSKLYIKNNICNGTPSNTEFEMRMINCTVFYGGSGETINIVGNSKFMNLNSQEIPSLNTKGIDFSNSKVYKPLKFIQTDSLPTGLVETEIYYNNTTTGKRYEYMNNSGYRNIITPTIINPNSNGSKPSFTPTCLTIAINSSLYNGDSLGWVFHPTTNDWIQLPQIGQRTYPSDPTNLLTPKRVGELVMDSTHLVWYISTGTTSADWKAITS